MSTVTVSSSSAEMHKAQQEDVTIGYFLKAKEERKKPHLEDVQGMQGRIQRLKKGGHRLGVYIAVY